MDRLGKMLKREKQEKMLRLSRIMLLGIKDPTRWEIASVLR